MKRLGLLAVALAATFAISGAAASQSMATFCVRVDVPNTGSWTNAACTEVTAGQQKNWVQVKRTTQQLPQHQWCAEVENASEALYKEPNCTNETGTLRYNKIMEHPSWWSSNIQLKQQTKQIKLQLKGKAALESTVGGLAVTIKCNTGVTEGATIEGSAFGSGQGKGRITFTSCSSSTCPPREPIVTKQTKSHLGMIAGQLKYGEIFEPTEGETFTEITLGGVCGVTLPAKGSVVAEVSPQEAETQEGLLNFPETAITKINLEGQEKTVSLKLGTEAAKFNGAFGTRLAEGQPLGVWGSN